MPEVLAELLVDGRMDPVNLGEFDTARGVQIDQAVFGVGTVQLRVQDVVIVLLDDEFNQLSACVKSDERIAKFAIADDAQVFRAEEFRIGGPGQAYGRAIHVEHVTVDLVTVIGARS